LTQFEKEVRKSLIDRDMNMSDLAEVLNISLAYLYDIFKGGRKAIGQRKKICKILNIKEDLINLKN